VVTIGFPNTALQQWVHEQSFKTIISTEVLNVFEWGKNCVADDYVKWKNAIVLKENKTTLHSMHIEEEVKGFPLATSTANRCIFVFTQLAIKNKLSKITA
jgi:hypothetical protein